MSATSSGDSSEATESLSLLESTYADTESYAVNGPACLIETGDLVSDELLVERGIRLGVKTLKQYEKETYGPLISYNVANGYLCLHKIDVRKHHEVDLFEYQPLQKAKEHYRIALRYGSIKPDLRKQVLVNLANVYDTLGRTVEAIHVYEEVLSIDPEFAMAEANLGKALYTFAGVCGEYRGATLVQAFRLISSALDKDQRLRQYGGTKAVKQFRQELERIRAHFVDGVVPDNAVVHPTMNTRRLSRFEQRYLEYCLANRLFLNFHIHESGTPCRASVVDSIMITLVESFNEESRFYHLTKHVNQMKEDFATARYLLFEAQHNRPFVSRISRMTTYVDTLDYTDNGLYIGLAKSAFVRAYSVLDKIAVFLDDYLQLETEGKIYFKTIWAVRRDGEWTVREAIRREGHHSLLGIFDINHDFRREQYKQLESIRNAVSHNRLIVSTFFSHATRELAGGDLSVGFDELEDYTIQVLLIVKSALSNLVNFVSGRETANHGNSDLIMPVQYWEQQQNF